MESLPLVEVASSSFDKLIIFCLLFGFSQLNDVKNPSLSFIKIGSPYSSFLSFDSELFLTFKSSLINLSLISGLIQTNDEMFSPAELHERRTYTNLLIPILRAITVSRVGSNPVQPAAKTFQK